MEAAAGCSRITDTRHKTQRWSRLGEAKPSMRCGLLMWVWEQLGGQSGAGSSRQQAV